MPDPAPPPPAEVRVSRLGGDGDGIAELPDGTLLYLPLTLPGERVMARPTGKRGEGWAGIATGILEPSPARVTPPCPHFGICGGCAVQHWADSHYAAWKANLIAGALRRAGFASDGLILQRTPPRARRRMDFALRRNQGSVTVGLHAARSDNLVDLQVCEILHPTLFALVAPLRIVLKSLTAFRREGSAIVNLLDSGPDLLLRLDDTPDSGDRTRLAAFAEAHGLPRITCAPLRGGMETAAQLRPAITRLQGVTIAPPPGAFLQASQAGEDAIVAAMLAGLPERLPARARVVELFAGVGTLTFALAKRARVVAYEGDRVAADCLVSAVNGSGLAGRVTIAIRDLARQPLAAKEMAGAAAIVLDPPYAGAAAQMEQIAAAGAPRVIYVSCNPAALVRDARVLGMAGYRLIQSTAIDQFLWSARVEGVAVFAR